MNCWSEYSPIEIASMHGMEREYKEKDMEAIEYCDQEECVEEKEEPISLESLGMSWRDFY
jgi:hypothetical protein